MMPLVIHHVQGTVFFLFSLHVDCFYCNCIARGRLKFSPLIIIIYCRFLSCCLSLFVWVCVCVCTYASISLSQISGNDAASLQEGRHCGIGIRSAQEVQWKAMATSLHAVHERISATGLLFQAFESEGQQCVALVDGAESLSQVPIKEINTYRQCAL